VLGCEEVSRDKAWAGNGITAGDLGRDGEEERVETVLRQEATYQVRATLNHAQPVRVESVYST